MASTPLSFEQLRSLTPLNALGVQQLQRLGEQLIPRPLLAGSRLFGLGDDQAHSYFLLAGTLVLDDGHQVQHLSADQAQACYPVSPSVPRQHTVTAATDCSYLALDTRQFNQLLARQADEQRLLSDRIEAGEDRQWLQNLLANPLFAKVPVIHIERLLQRLERVEKHAGDWVISAGQSADCCYFMRSGQAQVLREGQVLAQLQPGDCFGEEALLSGAPRNASVQMLASGVVMRLAREDFVALLQEPVVGSVTFAQAVRLLATGAQWLDVRVLAEYEQAHAQQALHMPLALLRLKSRLLVQGRTYLCYCDAGERSQAAVFLLSELGFEAYALAGGVDSLPAVQRDALLCERGAGYLARSGGRIVRSH